MNLQDIFVQANSTEIKQGMNWYTKGNEYLYQMSIHLNTENERVTGIVSALSPKCPWKQNIVDAYNLIRTKGKCKVVTYRPQKKKALQILRLPGKHLSRIPEILRGPKTTEFYKALCEPFGHNLPVIDTHVVRASLGLYVKNENTEKACKRAISGYGMAYMQNDIMTIAKRYKIHPNQCQAIIWSVWKRITHNKVYANSFPSFMYLTVAPKYQDSFDFGANVAR